MEIYIFTVITVIICVLLSCSCYAVMKEMDNGTHEKHKENGLEWVLKYWINLMGFTICSMCAFFGSLPLLITAVKYLIGIFRE